MESSFLNLKAVLYLVILFGSTSSKYIGRELICRSDNNIKCIWLEDHLSRPRGFPIHSSVYDHSKSFLYCFEGSFWSITPNPVVRFWDQLRVVIDTATPTQLEVTYGNDSKTAFHSSTTLNTTASNPARLSPFESSCVAVKSVRGGSGCEYSVTAAFHFNPAYPILFLVGSFLLFLSPRYSRNSASVYTAGVLIGVVGSVLVLLYFFSRLIPGRNFVGLGLLAGGTTLYGTVLYWSVDVLHKYWVYVVVYVLLSGFISFAVLYIKGVSNPRTMDILCWTLQLLGVGLLYCAASSTVTSILLVGFMLLTYVTPLRYNPLVFPLYLVWTILKLLWRLLKCLNPFKPRLPTWEYMTLEDYEEEGCVQTDKALTQLMEDYLEGKLDTSRLRDPARFDRFARGEHHIAPEEQVSHDWDFESFEDFEDLEEEEDLSSSVDSHHSDHHLKHRHY